MKEEIAQLLKSYSEELIQLIIDLEAGEFEENLLPLILLLRHDVLQEEIKKLIPAQDDIV